MISPESPTHHSIDSKQPRARPSYKWFHLTQPKHHSAVFELSPSTKGTKPSVADSFLLCFLYLTFAKSTDPSIFISGMTDWRHVHQHVKEHEQSIAHRNCAYAYFLQASKAKIKSLLSGNQMYAHRDQARKKRLWGSGAYSGYSEGYRQEGACLQGGKKWGKYTL